MQVCGLPFEDTAWVLQWHVIGMFAPGFVTGHLIKRFGALPIMGVMVLLNIACIAVALSGLNLHQFLFALLMLGVGWNFLFTGSTTLSMQAYTSQEKIELRRPSTSVYLPLWPLPLSHWSLRKVGHGLIGDH